MRSFLLGAKTEVKDVPTARDYVRDGLIAMWDGIENAGWGVHDATATVWKDLVGGNNFSISRTDTEPVSWDDISLVCGAKTIGVGASSISNIVTMEVVEGHVNRSPCLVCQFNSSRQFCFGSNEFGLTFTQSSKNASINTGVENYDYEVIRSVSAEYGENNEMSRVSQDNVPMQLLDRQINFGYYGCRVASATNSYGNFIGRIMAIRLYARALTASEISANYAIDARRFGL